MRRSLFLFIAIAAVLPAASPAATWSIDPVHSVAHFRVRHLAVSYVSGSFGKVSGVVRFDASDPTKSSVEATIRTATIDTGVADRDKHLKSSEFLDVEKYPTIRFKSKRVERTSPGHLAVTGDLTLHGVTKEVVLHVDGPTPPVKDPWDNLRTGASATITINRHDFGISWSQTLDGGGLVVGNDVLISIDLEMVRKLDAAGSP